MSITSLILGITVFIAIFIFAGLSVSKAISDKNQSQTAYYFHLILSLLFLVCVFYMFTQYLQLLSEFKNR